MRKCAPADHRGRIECTITMESDARYLVFGRDGVFDRDQMRDLIRHGEVTSVTEIAREGNNTWQAAATYPELARYLSLARSEKYRAPATASISTPKSLLGVGLIISGLLAVIEGGYYGFHGMASRHWPSVEARLFGAQVVTAYTPSRGDYQTRDVRVIYDYTVGGRRYTSSGISFGNELKSLLTPSAQMEAIRQERPTLAYYDPARPGRAVLHPGLTFGALQWLVIGLASVLGGVLLRRGSTSVRPAIDQYYAVSEKVDAIASWLFKR
jgi:hypothetical protein